MVCGEMQHKKFMRKCNRAVGFLVEILKIKILSLQNDSRCDMIAITYLGI